MSLSKSICVNRKKIVFFFQGADRGCGGIAVILAPKEFLKVIEDTAAQLLEHLHILSQEALDHADLTVLTGKTQSFLLLLKLNFFI